MSETENWMFKYEIERRTNGVGKMCIFIRVVATVLAAFTGFQLALVYLGEFSSTEYGLFSTTVSFTMLIFAIRDFEHYDGMERSIREFDAALYHYTHGDCCNKLRVVPSKEKYHG